MHAADVVADDYKTMYTPFDGTKKYTTGKGEDVSLGDEGTWCAYDMCRSAYKRGLQCADLEAMWMLKILMMVKYGRRSNFIISYGNKGHGDRVENGATRKYGMQDSEFLPDQSQFANEGFGYYKEKKGVPVTYPIYVGDAKYDRLRANSFLGIENVSSVGCFVLDRCEAVRPSGHPSHVDMVDVNLNVRKEKIIQSGVVSAKHVVWGRRCSLMCTVGGGSSVIGYNTFQYISSNGNGVTFSLSKSLTSGCFSEVNNQNRAYSDRANHSRLMFRGNIEEVTDIDEYLNAEEVRYDAEVES